MNILRYHNGSISNATNPIIATNWCNDYSCGQLSLHPWLHNLSPVLQGSQFQNVQAASLILSWYSWCSHHFLTSTYELYPRAVWTIYEPPWILSMYLGMVGTQLRIPRVIPHTHFRRIQSSSNQQHRQATATCRSTRCESLPSAVSWNKATFRRIHSYWWG